MSRYVLHEHDGRVRVFRDPWVSVMGFAVPIGFVLGGALLALWDSHFDAVLPLAAFALAVGAVAIPVVHDRFNNPVTVISAAGLVLRQPPKLFAWGEIERIEIRRRFLLLHLRRPLVARFGWPTAVQAEMKTLRLPRPLDDTVPLYGMAISLFEGSPLTHLRYHLRGETGTAVWPLSLGGASPEEVAAAIAAVAPGVPLVRV